MNETIQELKLFDNSGSIYNIDEKVCRLTIHKQQIVLVKKGSKPVYLYESEHEENVSIVGFENAFGQSVSPFVHFKGQRLKKGWSDHLHNFYLFKNPGSTLIIFDGANSHLDIFIFDAADLIGVTLFCLPSNISHELQPMD